MKTIGIIGSGAVGKALAKGFMKYGYPTAIASRSETTRQTLTTELGDNIKVDSPENIAKNNDIIVFAVKGGIAKEALQGLGIENLTGKTIIDATNPIADEAPDNGVLRYFSQINQSLMEELQALAPNANFVKAFCSVGSHAMVDPQFETKPTMFICGNNNQAKQEVNSILDQFGWEIEDMGAVEAARAIEPLAMLWCIPGFRENRWSHAFKLLK